MRTRIALVLTALTGLVLLLCPPVQADGTDGVDTDAVPVAGKLTITGNGFGHGRGLSQYGANGAAKAGLSAAQILAFYYPGTQRTQLSTRVRVWLTGDSDRSLVVRPESGLKVTDLRTGRAFTLPSIRVGAKAWRLAVVNGRSRVFFLKAGTWHLYRTAGRIALAGNGEFRTKDGTVTVAYGGANHVYRGQVRLTDGRSVNVLSLDNYLRGVVASEMPASWHPNALRAQAVAARTYAAFERAAHVDRSYQICDTSACQVYRGVAAEYPSTNAAVTATAGWILTAGGQPAFTQFSASNGGWSAYGGRSYLPAHQDGYDQAYRGWTKSLTAAAVQKAYPGIGTLVSARVTARDGAGEWGGRVTSVLLHGSKKDVTVSGGALRSLAGLRSEYFRFS